MKLRRSRSALCLLAYPQAAQVLHSALFGEGTESHGANLALSGVHTHCPCTINRRGLHPSPAFSSSPQAPGFAPMSTTHYPMLPATPHIRGVACMYRPFIGDLLISIASIWLDMATLPLLLPASRKTCWSSNTSLYPNCAFRHGCFHIRRSKPHVAHPLSSERSCANPTTKLLPATYQSLCTPGIADTLLLVLPGPPAFDGQPRPLCDIVRLSFPAIDNPPEQPSKCAWRRSGLATSRRVEPVRDASMHCPRYYLCHPSYIVHPSIGCIVSHRHFPAMAGGGLCAQYTIGLASAFIVHSACRGSEPVLECLVNMASLSMSRHGATAFTSHYRPCQSKEFATLCQWRIFAAEHD